MYARQGLFIRVIRMHHATTRFVSGEVDKIYFLFLKYTAIACDRKRERGFYYSSIIFSY